MPAWPHPDIQKFDGFRCCLSCGETVFEDVLRYEEEVDRPESLNYRYKRLNYELGHEIRLVVLYAGHKIDDLVCDIIHCNLLDKPVYEAVSYTWASLDGDSTLSRYVSCRGKKIVVTRNCESMLRTLRKQGGNRTIWVDAMCIDQENTGERNHQVKLMATIYSNASQVLAYLGPGSQSASVSLNWVMEYLEGNVNKVSSTRSYHDVTTFLRIPYFDRVWVRASIRDMLKTSTDVIPLQVLQEIALAKMVTLIAGDKSTRWTADTVSKLLGLCTSLEIQPPSVLRWLPASQPDSNDLLDVLQRSRNCSATDIRDKVFALLGLVKQEISDAITVDYSRAAIDIFNDIAVHLVKEYGRIDVVLHAACQDTDEFLVPSWVPQWDIKSSFKPLPSQFSPTQVDTLAISWFNGSSTERFSSHLTEEERQKQRTDYASTNFRFDVCLRHSINRTSPLPSLRIRAQFLDTITKCLLTKSARHPIFPRELPDAFRGPDPCSECQRQGILPVDPTTLTVDHKRMLHGYHDSSIDSGSIERQRTAFKDVMYRLGLTKTSFETQSSRGAAHEAKGVKFQIGDTIWALAGLAVPVILRSKGDYHVLIGECYLFRAALPFPCVYCGGDATPWPMVTEVIDIW
jgi:hypothetical protein